MAMKKPYMRLSTCLRALGGVSFAAIAWSSYHAVLTDMGEGETLQLVVIAGVALLVLLVAYLAVELVGIRSGFIEDDVGVPPSDSGGSRVAFMRRVFGFH